MIIQKSVCSALASLPYNINFEVSPAKEEMNNKNAKIFKFPRKQMQVSEEIKNKKVPSNPQKIKSPIKIEKILKEEPRERKNIVIFKEAESDDLLQEEMTSHIESKVTLKQSDRASKVDQFIQMSEKGVLFDKKLTKLAIPDPYEKLKFVNRLENKLLNCLEKKKAVIPMKKLVSVEMLNDLLNKNPRKVVTNSLNYIEKLDCEAQSMRKADSKESKQSSIQQPQKKAEGKVKMNLIPLRVPNFAEPEESNFFQAEETSNFIFEQAVPSKNFGFFRNQSQQVDQIRSISTFSQESAQRIGPYQEKLDKINQKRQQSSQFFKFTDEYEFDNNMFQRQSSKPQQNKRKRNTFDIAKIKVPKLQKNRETLPKYGIFSIEQEVSTFFPPENEGFNQGKLLNNAQAGQKFWPSNESSSQFSYSHDAYY